VWKIFFQFRNLDIKKSILNGLVDFITTADLDKHMVLKLTPYFINDIHSISKILQKHSIFELFIQNISDQKSSRFNATFNIQWAIDVRNNLSN
jgi:hypothetical protein